MTNLELIEALEIKTSMLFNLVLPSNTILSCFLFFFVIIDLYLILPAVIALVFNPIAELIIPVGISTKETKQEIEINPVAAEAKTRTCSM